MLLPTTAAALWHHPLARMSVLPQPMFYTTRPYWPSALTSPWSMSHGLPPWSEPLARSALQLHRRAIDEVFSDLHSELERMRTGGLQDAGDDIQSEWHIGAGFKEDSISAELQRGGRQLAITGELGGWVYKSKIGLPFAVRDASALSLKYDSKTGLLSMSVPKEAMMKATSVQITPAPESSKDDASGHAAQGEAAAEDRKADTPAPRDEQAEQAMLDEKYAFLKEQPAAEQPEAAEPSDADAKTDTGAKAEPASSPEA